MVAAELSRPRPEARLLAAGVWRCWLAAYAAVWGVTLLCAGVVALTGGPLQEPVRGLLGLRLNPSRTVRPELAHALALAAHNIPVCCWPLLLGVIGAHRSPVGRRLADVLVAGSVTVNVMQVGLALGAYGLPLLPFVPQLPFEWAALALGATGWRLQRARPLTVRQGVSLLMVAVLLLVFAGFLETFAVPRG